MKRPLLLLALAVALPVAAQSDYVSDDAGKTTGGLWTEIEATKVLPYDLSLGLDAGFRTNEWFSEANRFDVSLGLNWKPVKHWKFGIAYTFIMKHSPLENAHKTEYKYRAAGLSENSDFAEFLGAPTYTDGTTNYTYRGKNIAARTTEAFWRPKHRISIDATYSYKFWKWMRISLRERYQLTFVPTKTVAREKVIDKYRDVSYSQATAATESDLTYDEVTRYWQQDDVIYAQDLLDPDATPTDVTATYQAEHDDLNTDKLKDSKTLHVLRSRLAFEVDKKGWKLSPFCYAEVFNNLGESMHLDKLRLAAGVDYTLTPVHKLSLGYIFNHENDDDGDMNIHAITIGYKFKF